MNKVPRQCVIIGGGSSIRQGLWDTPIEYLPVWQAIKNKFVITVNWAYLWHRPTVAMFGDYRFYEAEKERLDNLPLVIGKNDQYYHRMRKQGIEMQGANLYLLNPCLKKDKNGDDIYFGKNSWENGFYSYILTGIVALTFAVQLGCREFFLLGSDYGEIDGHTHFYDDTEIGIIKRDNLTYTGIGKDSLGNHLSSRYNYEEVNPKTLKKVKIEANNPDKWYSVFNQEKDVQIYNVSPKSNIGVLPKIDFKEFYKRMKPRFPAVIQSNVRSEICRQIKEYQKEIRL